MIKKIRLLTASATCITILLLNISCTRSQEFSTGLLWEINSPSGGKNYIFGTLHLVNSKMDAVADVIKNYEKNARVVLLEYPTDTSNPTPSSLKRTKNKISIHEQFLPEEFSMLVQIMEKKKIPLYVLDNASLFTIYSLLINSNIIAKPQMDYQFMQFANQENIVVKSLENNQERNEQMAILGEELLVELIKKSIHDPKETEHLIAKMETRYLAEDLDYLLDSMWEIKADRKLIQQFMEVIVIQRTENMLKNALPELERGGAFMAIGAGHLAGEKGALNLLKKKGYTLTKVKLNLPDIEN